jgi:hypothetical protein
MSMEALIIGPNADHERSTLEMLYRFLPTVVFLYSMASTGQF